MPAFRRRMSRRCVWRCRNRLSISTTPGTASAAPAVTISTPRRANSPCRARWIGSPAGAEESPRMSIDHVSVGVTNMRRSKAFYDAALAPLGMAPVYPVEIGGQLVGVGYGTPEKPSFWIQLPINGQPASMGNGVHIAFRAATREAVDAFFLA